MATWEADGTPEQREFPLSVGSDKKVGETLKLLQGARLITEAQVQAGGAGSPHKAMAKRQKRREHRRLEQLSWEYGLASRAMSLVAVLERATDQPGELPKTRVVPVGMPEDTAFEAYFQSTVSQPQGSCGVMPSAPPPAAMASFGVDFCRDDSPLRSWDDESCPSSSAVAEPYDIPAIARRNKSRFFDDSPRPLPEPVTPEDTLVELAARLEGDGGLPGQDPQERVLCTMVALLCFLGQDGAAGQGPFSRHLMLMVKFLALASLPALGEAFERVKRQLLDAANAGQPVPGDWFTLARDCVIEHKMAGLKVWKEIQQRIGSLNDARSRNRFFE